MVMQIQFARFINFPMAISIEVGFMNPLPTKCSRQFCMQVQEGKNFAKFCFSFAGYRGRRGKFKMPRFLSSEKSEVRRKKSREENDYGSIASLLRNEVSTVGKNHWKKSHIQSTSKINPGKNWELFIYIFFRANLHISNTQPILSKSIDFIWDFCKDFWCIMMAYKSIYAWGEDFGVGERWLMFVFFGVGLAELWRRSKATWKLQRSSLWQKWMGIKAHN